MNIILIGFKNSGKTSVGKVLATALKFSFVDTDDLIENEYLNVTQEKLTVRDIFKTKGENYFRILEKKILKTLSTNKEMILATGGGVVLDEDNRAWLRAYGKIVYLFAPFAVTAARNKAELPAFIAKKTLKNIYQERKQIYEQLANCQINTENKSVSEIATEIMTWIYTLRDSNHGK